MLYPHEAKLAMEKAHAHLTLEFTGISATNGLSRNLRGVDLNELPSEQVKRLQERLCALQKTGNSNSVILGTLFKERRRENF